jgi:hypothetical protein
MNDFSKAGFDASHGIDGCKGAWVIAYANSAENVSFEVTRFGCAIRQRASARLHYRYRHPIGLPEIRTKNLRAASQGISLTRETLAVADGNCVFAPVRRGHLRIAWLHRVCEPRLLSFNMPTYVHLRFVNPAAVFRDNHLDN